MTRGSTVGVFTDQKVKTTIRVQCRKTDPVNAGRRRCRGSVLAKRIVEEGNSSIRKSVWSERFARQVKKSRLGFNITAKRWPKRIGWHFWGYEQPGVYIAILPLLTCKQVFTPSGGMGRKWLIWGVISSFPLAT